jgi:hypothetical protein
MFFHLMIGWRGGSGVTSSALSSNWLGLDSESAYLKYLNPVPGIPIDTHRLPEDDAPNRIKPSPH